MERIFTDLNLENFHFTAFIFVDILIDILNLFSKSSILVFAYAFTRTIFEQPRYIYAHAYICGNAVNPVIFVERYLSHESIKLLSH